MGKPIDQTYLRTFILDVYVSNNTILARKKAELINENTIYIPKTMVLPYPLEQSTAGPDAGLPMITLAYDNTNIKLAVRKENREIFSLRKIDSEFIILKKSEVFLENVRIVANLFHAPGQVFINLDDRCIYNCAFCNLPNQGYLIHYAGERFVTLILNALKRKEINSIAITSGVYPDNRTIIEKMCFIMQQIRKQDQFIPIGVESCIFDKKEIIALKNAGADEIKINVQIANKQLFEKICPDFDYDHILSLLKSAVGIFGKGKVASNIIYGLGESDKDLVQAINRLSGVGVVPTLRKIRINQFNKKKLEKRMGSKIPKLPSERILQLAYKQKKILEKYNLTTKSFDTMCHKCGCCDIVPYRDI